MHEFSHLHSTLFIPQTRSHMSNHLNILFKALNKKFHESQRVIRLLDQTLTIRLKVITDSQQLFLLKQLKHIETGPSGLYHRTIDVTSNKDH